MACKDCSFKGFVESAFLKDAKEYSSIVMCTKCKDISKYSDEVQKRYSTKATVTVPETRGLGKVISLFEHQRIKGIA